MSEQRSALAIVRGWGPAVETLRRWRDRPLRIVTPWLLLSLFIAIVLLVLVWLVGRSVPPETVQPGAEPLTLVPDNWPEVARHLFRNNLIVLALHATACLAGFIVHMALHEPVEEEGSRLEYWTRLVAIVAVAFVPMATILSIGTQAWILGARVSTLSDQLRLPEGTILITTLPHSLPELTAIFLPLAAWLVLPFQRRANELLAATMLSVALAVPVLAIAAVVEVRVWPERLLAAQDEHPAFEGAALGELKVDPYDPNSARAMLTAGPRIGAEEYGSRDAALDAGRRSKGGAAIVIRTKHGFVVHQVLARRESNRCDSLVGMRQAAQSSISLDELRTLSWSIMFMSDRQDVFVQGDRELAAADAGIDAATDADAIPAEPRTC